MASVRRVWSLPRVERRVEVGHRHRARRLGGEQRQVVAEQDPVHGPPSLRGGADTRTRGRSPAARIRPPCALPCSSSARPTPPSSRCSPRWRPARASGARRPDGSTRSSPSAAAERLEAADAEELADARDALRAALTRPRGPVRRGGAGATRSPWRARPRSPAACRSSRRSSPGRASSTSRGSRTAPGWAGRDRAAARRPRGAARRSAGAWSSTARCSPTPRAELQRLCGFLGPALRPGAADARRGGARRAPGPRPGGRGGARGAAAARRPVPQREHRLVRRAPARARRLAADHDLSEQPARGRPRRRRPPQHPLPHVRQADGHRGRTAGRIAARHAHGGLGPARRARRRPASSRRAGATTPRSCPARGTSPATSPCTISPSRAASSGSWRRRSRASRRSTPSTSSCRAGRRRSSRPSRPATAATSTAWRSSTARSASSPRSAAATSPAAGARARPTAGCCSTCRLRGGRAGGLCMPHSPRWHDGRLWLLESGRGALCVVDPATGQRSRPSPSSRASRAGSRSPAGPRSSGSRRSASRPCSATCR